MEQQQLPPLDLPQWIKACVNILVLEFYFPTSEAERFVHGHLFYKAPSWHTGITPFEAVLESL